MSAENATYLYAIRARYTPFVKIGVTSDPQGRIKRMQTETPHTLCFAVCAPCERAYDIEQWMHSQLKHRHIRGEWFWFYLDRAALRVINQGKLLDEQDKLPRAPSAMERYGVAKPKSGFTEDQLLTLYVLLRTSGVTRDRATPALKAAGIPVNNNLWTRAAPTPPPAEDGEYRTPIAGRATSAVFETGELAYEPPPTK